MLTVLLSLALSLTPSALACGGGHDCGGKCPMPAAADADADAVDAAAGTKLTLAVSGVHCPMTAAHVRAALLKLEGVNAVAVDTTGGTRVAFDDEATDRERIVAAIDAVEGFKATIPDAG